MFLTRTPAPPLSGFVAHLWLFEGPAAGPHFKERILPTGGAQLVVNLLEDSIRVYDREDPRRVESSRGVGLAGPHARHFVIDTAEQRSCAGIVFRPGGAYPFFGLPAAELQDVNVGVESLWGPRSAALRDRLLEAPAPEARFAVLEEALLAAARRAEERHPAVRFALRELATVPHTPVGEVTSQLGMSPRRFIQLFRAQVGLTPKLFCRVRRFQEVIQRIPVTGPGPVDWAEVALASGYFDQAHLIRDFKDFSGLTPAALLALPREHRNHVPLSE